MNIALVTFTIMCGVACTGAETTSSETDIMDLLSAIDDEQTTVSDFGDTLQLEQSLTTVNCRLSCGLTDYKRTCGCTEKQCIMWKNPCVARCNGATLFENKREAECRSSNSHDVNI